MAIYLVTTRVGDSFKERLVQAATRAGARNHVAKDMVDVAVASQATLFRIAKAGGALEEADADTPQSEPEPPPVGPGGDMDDAGQPVGDLIDELPKRDEMPKRRQPAKAE